MFAVDITHSLQTSFLNHSPFLCISLKDLIKLPLQTSLIFCVGSLDVSISLIFFSDDTTSFVDNFAIGIFAAKKVQHGKTERDDRANFWSRPSKPTGPA